jgi:hypothetical protein
MSQALVAFSTSATSSRSQPQHACDGIIGSLILIYGFVSCLIPPI